MSEQKMREAFEVWWRAVLNDPYKEVGIDDKHIARFAWNAALAQQPAAVVDCGACPGDGSVCIESCRLNNESPPIKEVNAVVELTDEEIEVIDFGMCGIREFPIAFARRIIAAHIANQSGERTC